MKLIQIEEIHDYFDLKQLPQHLGGFNRRGITLFDPNIVNHFYGSSGYE